MFKTWRQILISCANTKHNLLESVTKLNLLVQQVNFHWWSSAPNTTLSLSPSFTGQERGYDTHTHTRTHTHTHTHTHKKKASSVVVTRVEIVQQLPSLPKQIQHRKINVIYCLLIYRYISVMNSKFILCIEV